MGLEWWSSGPLPWRLLLLAGACRWGRLWLRLGRVGGGFWGDCGIVWQGLSDWSWGGLGAILFLLSIETFVRVAVPGGRAGNGV
jgi:hypothetical protein